MDSQRPKDDLLDDVDLTPEQAARATRLREACVDMPFSCAAEIIYLRDRLNDARGALRASRPYVERYEPKDVSEAHDRDLLLTSIEALQE
jgi:hypothetical protein